MVNVPYDVFLSHNSEDKAQVEKLAARLARKAGIRPWLDKWNLIPGDPWQPAIEQALAVCRSCAVFVGRSEIGPWQLEEMRAAISRRVTDANGHFRVIPVLLPPGSRELINKLPPFLSAASWVEFSNGLADRDAFRRLVCGIQGKEPGPNSPRRPKNKSVRWVLVLDGEYEDQTRARTEAIAEHLRTLLSDARLTIRRIDPGSLVIVLESSLEAFELMKDLVREHQLNRVLDMDVLNVQAEDDWKARHALKPAFLLENPFDSIEGSHEYVALLAEVLNQVRRDVEAEIQNAEREAGDRRKEALLLVSYNLAKLNLHITSSRRILNDLRTLRRLLLSERTGAKGKLEDLPGEASG